MNRDYYYGILEELELNARREGARDALVNLKKFMRESSVGTKPEAIRLVDDFMILSLGKFIQS